MSVLIIELIVLKGPTQYILQTLVKTRLATSVFLLRSRTRQCYHEDARTEVKKVLHHSASKTELRASENTFLKITKGPSIYYVSKGLGGWVKKIASFADMQYCIYADLTT